jgi:hypothetical protein
MILFIRIYADSDFGLSEKPANGGQGVCGNHPRRMANEAGRKIGYFNLGESGLFSGRIT